MNQLSLIEAEARAAYPHEACGLLLGHGGGAESFFVSDVIASPNVAPGGRHARFEIDPALILHHHRALRGTPSRILGLYHSHPRGQARPSLRDSAEAWTPGLVWLIVSLDRQRITGRGAFLHPDGVEPPVRFAPLALHLRSSA